MHIFGIVFLFLAAILPLSFWSVPVFGAPTTVATMLALPVLIYWLLLDVPLGLGIVGAAVLLLSAAVLIVDHASVTAVWSIAAVLAVAGVTSQVVGHRLFERRAPALVDNPTHFLLGPMFVMAKLFIALGFRHDLALIIEPGSQPEPVGSSFYAEEARRESQPRS